jgi:hypothetical protein
MKFADDPGGIEPDRGVVIGRGDGHVIIAFKKAMALRDNGNGNGNGNGSESSGRSDGNPGPSAAAAAGGAAESPRYLSPGGPGAMTPPSRPRSPVVRIAPLPGSAMRDSPV